MRAPPSTNATIDAALAIDGIEATFVAADPPRRSWLALWHPELAPGDATDAIDLVTQDDGPGTGVQTVPTPVVRVDIEDAIEGLTSHDEHPSASVRAWAVATRTALTLISRGRVQPSLTIAGVDTWRVSRLTNAERDHIDQLAAALPPAAHNHALAGATGDDGNADRRSVVATRPATVDRFLDAIVDRFVRTGAAPVLAGHLAFATTGDVTIDNSAALHRLEHLMSDRPPLTVLTLDPPTLPEGPFLATLRLQSRADPRLTVPAAALWDAGPDVRRRLRTTETSLLLNLRRAAGIWKPMGRLLEQAQPTSMELSESEIDELSGTAAGDLGAAGVSVLWPQDLIHSIDLRPVVGSPSDAPELGHVGRTARLDLSSLLELRWRGTIDGQELTEAELNELAEAKRSVVRLRGQWIRVDENQVRRLRERRSIGTSTALAAALGGAARVESDDGSSSFALEVEGPLASLGERLRDLDLQRTIHEPSGLTAVLRPYQRRGLAWLAEMDDLGLGGILADDMGLGKTVQILALHVLREPDRPTLVICPTSVVGNWERETNRFAPGVPVRRYHGADRNLDDLPANAVVLTSYGIARRDAEMVASVDWGLVVADEAQAIKNPYSRTARALRRFPAQTRFALTGTPVQNQLSDLWAILDWATPGLLGSLHRFRQDLAGPIERDGDPEVTAQLNRLLRPFVLRRRKADPDIAPDLPPKTETDEIVPLTVEQATLYKAVVSEVMAEIAAATGIERRGLVLRLVTRLKQVCNHPEHLLGEGGPLEHRSGKLTAVDELIDVIREEGEACLVFTQYVEMGHLLVAHFEDRGITTRFLHGGVPLAGRDEMVAEFQTGDVDVFVVSLRAGGTGLNLTAATHVVHYDRWWNPAVEDQASDRAWRIGQDRPVQIHRLICEGTIEDRIALMLNEKRALADAVVGSGEGWISELSDDDLNELVALADDTVQM